MNSRPKISIIIAVKDGEATLDRCLHSISLQGYANLELIVIDGLSSDRTPQIVEDWRPHVTQSVRESDQGIYDAWNKGVRLASGEWLCFLGADDTLLPGALHGYIMHARRSSTENLEFMSSRAIVFDPATYRERVIGQPWAWKKLCRRMGVVHIGAFHHRRLLERVGAFDISTKIVGDYDFMLRAGPGLRAAHYPATTVRIQSTGVSRRSYRVLGETLRTRRKLLALPARVLLPQHCLDTAKFAIRRALGVP
jgi:glycosyltransferase involved in cell wall biosynthesis